MDAEEYVLILLHLLQIWINVVKLTQAARKRRRIRRRWWVKPHLLSDIRINFGAHMKLCTYFRTSDHDEFFKMTRMSVHQFDHLHDLLKPKLLKRSRREPLPTELRVAVTLRLVFGLGYLTIIAGLMAQNGINYSTIIFFSYLSHGDSVTTTSWHFRIGKTTLYSIIPEVCNAIWEVLQPTYLTHPQEEEGWFKIADDFCNIWNFPNCIGAIDGKHCRIKSPPNTGSAFHNYKDYFSLVLMGIVDAHYRFIWVDIGDYGM